MKSAGGKQPPMISRRLARGFCAVVDRHFVSFKIFWCKRKCSHNPMCQPRVQVSSLMTEPSAARRPRRGRAGVRAPSPRPPRCARLGHRWGKLEPGVLSLEKFEPGVCKNLNPGFCHKRSLNPGFVTAFVTIMNPGFWKSGAVTEPRVQVFF